MFAGGNYDFEECFSVFINISTFSANVDDFWLVDSTILIDNFASYFSHGQQSV